MLVSSYHKGQLILSAVSLSLTVDPHVWMWEKLRRSAQMAGKVQCSICYAWRDQRQSQINPKAGLASVCVCVCVQAVVMICFHCYKMRQS